MIILIHGEISMGTGWNNQKETTQLYGGVCLNYSPLKVSTTKKTIVVPFLAEEGLLQNYENFKQP